MPISVEAGSRVETPRAFVVHGEEMVERRTARAAVAHELDGGLELALCSPPQDQSWLQRAGVLMPNHRTVAPIV